MMKKLLPLVFILQVLFAFAQNNTTYNLLWRISGNGLKQPSYLFGTMHVRDARAFNFSDSVMPSLERCQAFALEIHPDTMIMDVFKGLFGRDTVKADINLEELLNKEDFEKLDTKFTERYGYSVNRLKVKNPFFLRAMLNKRETNSSDKSTFVDAHLLGIAKTLNKEIYGLEKTKDQLDFFNSLPKETLKEQLEDVLTPEENSGIKSKALENLTEVYARGNVTEIEKLAIESRLYDTALIKRNYVMLTSLTGIMHHSSVFTAVGAAHLPGKEGLIQLLRNKGYAIAPVAASFTGVSKKYTVDALKMEWKKQTDSINGFSILSPGNFYELDIIPGLSTQCYFDLSNLLTYGYYAINMSEGAGTFNEQKIVNEIIDNYKKNKRFGISKTNQFIKDGTTITELYLKSGGSQQLRLRLFLKNRVLYSLFVGGEGNSISSAIVEKYFNSFSAFPKKTRKNPEWITLKPDEGAFSISMPNEPRKISKVVPREENSDPYILNMYMCTNMGTMSNYLVRYNDFPSQMYVDDKQKIYTSFVEEISGANTILSGLDTVWLDGIDGRQFSCLIAGKSYAQIRLFVRGNRTYVLLRQNLMQNSTKMADDGFFESFAFEPYKDAPGYLLKPEGENYEINLPVKPKVIIDTLLPPGSSYNRMQDYYATNPNSGGLYHFESSGIKSLYKLKSKTDYYKTFIKGTLTIADTLLSSDSIQLNGFYAREFVISNHETDTRKRCRVWFSDNKLFYMALHSGREELFNEESDRYFNSFRLLSPESPGTLHGSKITKITEGLLSKDTTTYKESINSFSYYEFDKTELSAIEQALKEHYTDDTLARGARMCLITALSEINDTAAFPALVKEFLSKSNNHLIKSGALRAIAQVNKPIGLHLYLNLLVSSSALNPSNDVWLLFSPLTDSLEFAREHFGRLLPLLDTAGYRNTLLNLAHRVVAMDTTGLFLQKYAAALTKHAIPDLENYFSLLALDQDITYHNEINNYLYFLKDSSLLKLADEYTGKLLSTNKADAYFRANAAALRIKLKLPLEKKTLNRFLNDYNTRFTVLTELQNTGSLGTVSSSYYAPKELGKLSLYNYLSDDGSSPKKLKYLGQITSNGKIYYAYTFSLHGEKSAYLGLSGHFVENEIPILDEINVYTNYEPKQKNWKEQALNLIENY